MSTTNSFATAGYRARQHPEDICALQFAIDCAAELHRLPKCEAFGFCARVIRFCEYILQRFGRACEKCLAGGGIEEGTDTDSWRIVVGCAVGPLPGQRRHVDVFDEFRPGYRLKNAIVGIARTPTAPRASAILDC